MMSIRRLYEKFDDIHEAVILKLRRLYGYEEVPCFSEAVI